MVLSQALAQERSKGNRDVIVHAIMARGEALRSGGEGSEGPTDEEELFIGHEKTSSPHEFFEHDQGSGSHTNRNLNPEQQALKKLAEQEKARRVGDLKELSDVQGVDDKGTHVYMWGHIMPPTPERKDKDGKVISPRRPSLVFLRYCPACGKQNILESGARGVCYHCALDMYDHLPLAQQKYPENFKGLWIERP